MEKYKINLMNMANCGHPYVSIVIASSFEEGINITIARLKRRGEYKYFDASTKTIVFERHRPGAIIPRIV